MALQLYGFAGHERRPWLSVMIHTMGSLSKWPQWGTHPCIDAASVNIGCHAHAGHTSGHTWLGGQMRANKESTSDTGALKGGRELTESELYKDRHAGVQCALRMY